MTFRHLLAFAAMVLAVEPALAQSEVITRPNVEYVEHDGVKLTGDLYLPKGATKAPVLIGIHGGGWQNGGPVAYQYWGPYLAKNGIGLFAIRYRLGKPGVYPKAVYDAKAAIQFVRAKAADLGVDPDRIGLMGESAGGHLVALLGLAANEFNSEYRNDPNAAVPANVKAVVSFFGVYDLLAQWQHDQIARPNDNISEKFLGVSPTKDRRIYFESSPINHAIVDHRGARFLLINGTHDDIVDPAQGQQFWQALNQAGIYSRRMVMQGAGHFFASDPLDEPGSYSGAAAPGVLRFLKGAL